MTLKAAKHWKPNEEDFLKVSQTPSWGNLFTPPTPHLPMWTLSQGHYRDKIITAGRTWTEFIAMLWFDSQITFSASLVSQSISSVAQSCLTLCNPMDCSMPRFPVHHQLPEFTQTHVHWVGDAIQSSHPQSSPSPPAFNLSQHQDLFKWVSSSHQVAEVLEFQLQHQSFQWIFRTDFL